MHGLSLAPAQRLIMEECIRRGQPPPESIQNAPVLFEGLHLYYTAFLDLNGCRQLGQAMGPIDWLAIDRYCQRYDIQEEQYEDMHYFVARMDEAFLTYHRERMKTPPTRTKTQAKPAPPPRRRKR